MNILAVMLWQMDERLPDLQLMSAAGEGRTRVLGPNHPGAIDSRQSVARMLAALGQQVDTN